MDPIVGHTIACRGHPLLVGVVRDLQQVLWVQRVEDVEEVTARWAFVLSEVVRKVLSESRVLREGRPELFDAQLIVSGHVDGGDGLLEEQLLLLGEDRLEKIFIYLRLWRQVVLQAKWLYKIRDPTMT